MTCSSFYTGASLTRINFRDATLFTRTSSGWIRSETRSFPIGQCRKIRNRDGKDGLVCFTDDMHWDSWKGWWLTFSYLPLEHDLELELLQVFDNTDTACDAARKHKSRLAVQSAIRQVKFLPSTEGKTTPRIWAECRRGLLSPEAQKACAGEGAINNMGPAQATRTYRIDYEFNGENFALAPYSKVVKRQFDVCSDDHGNVEPVP